MSEPRRASSHQSDIDYVRLPNGQLKPAVPLDSVVTTAELSRRRARPPDYEAENRALVSLMQELANPSGNVLQKLAETVLDLCEAQSAGISILEEENGRKIFRWHATAGQWSGFLGATMPREISPCGTVLDRNAPILFSHPERHFPFPPEISPPIDEVLLVPFHVAGEPVGTIWVIAHDEGRKFDREDERLITSLGKFAAIAYQVSTAGHALEVQFTERKRAEDAVRESEQRFRHMIDALPTAIYTTDSEGRLTHFNPAAAEFSGRVPELGSDQWCVSWKMFRPDGTPLPHDQCPMAAALKGAPVVPGAEVIAERPNGTRIWFTPFPTAIHDTEGKIVGGINMLLDITERKKVEESRAYLGAIVESSDDAIIGKDLNGIITSWNKSAERLFGYTAQEAIGRRITMLIPADRLGEEPEILARLKRGERLDHFETVRVHKDGSLLELSLTVSPVKNSAGHVIGASKIARDVTKRKRAEEALRESEEKYKNLVAHLEEQVQLRTRELVERNAEVLQQAEQLRGLSHRLMQIQDEERRRIARDLHDSAGQYLAALGMSLEAARQHAKRLPDGVAQQEVMQKLDEASEMTRTCSSEIRTLSHLLHPPLLEELGLISAINWYVEGFATRGDVQVNLQMPPKLKRVGDDIELALFRVLQECLTNIHRHSGSKTATVKVEADEHRASLEVSDQGTGIPKALDDSRSAGRKRPGIGISGMRERLKDLGGTLEIDSSEHGTTVRAIIPLQQQPAQDVN